MRTKGRNFEKTILFYEKECEPLVISKKLIDLFREENNPGDLIALYVFYYYTAKWQETNKAYSTTAYTANGLNWSIPRVRKTKQVLIRLGLIEDRTQRDKKGLVVGHFVYVRFVWSDAKIKEIQETKGISSTPQDFHRVVKQRTNALSDNNKNISPAKKNLSRECEQNPYKSSNQEKIEPYLPYAKKLSEIIQQKKNIKITPSKLNQWGKHIYHIEKTDGISLKRIRNALIWYAKHIGEKFVPVIESGMSLREKFLKLEAAIERSGETIKPEELRNQKTEIKHLNNPYPVEDDQYAFELDEYENIPGLRGNK